MVHKIFIILAAVQCLHKLEFTLAGNMKLGELQHPCAKVARSGGVFGWRGNRVRCIFPAKEELRKQLIELGGYNKHYMAVTLKEAEENFVNLMDENKRPWLYNDDVGSDATRSKRSTTIQCSEAGSAKSSGYLRACRVCQKLTEYGRIPYMVMMSNPVDTILFKHYI
ncbi:uncharacterized protein LOC5519761 [Nematostella vectensis]|uniref:uncharacterized protein LOC5519761 n=1 Tax=Nematostella vectensis TaxID=45351 RepID=UPI0020775A32|nr:uncharacterized protein LOC5519761 [Nematostella vectensis]XP_048585382.1 uncharacterized protein LOC5519761 [Nematostella vectensis]